MKQYNAPELEKQPASAKNVRRHSIIAFAVFLMCMALGGGAFLWLYHEPATADNVQPVLRSGLQANEKLFSFFYTAAKNAKHYGKKDAVKNVRVNGLIGMEGTVDTATWRMKVVKAPGDTLLISLHDIMQLPKTEVVFDFKCIEGWSQVTWWGGVRFIDFLKKYNLLSEGGMKYVGLATPDGAYYVGNDMPSMLQPQTLLCYEMNGQLLPMNQGYPLRLIIPVKYGIKNMKRIGTMYFSNDKPRDYWAEQGYDYYAGL